MAVIVLSLGIVSLILAYNIILELVDLGWLQSIPIDDQTRETIDNKMANLFIEIIFAVGMITFGIVVLKRGSLKEKKKKPRTAVSLPKHRKDTCKRIFRAN